MSLNLPNSWGQMSSYAKLCYLVNSHQARDFSEAGKLLARKKKVETANKGVDKPREIRLPYADN
jgi:hypothetical protein